MTFLAAGWLALLVPWAALVAWAWRRIADEHSTTATFLWKSSDVDVPRSEARRGRPPLWVIVSLLAVLTMVVSVSQPAYRSHRAKVTVLVDRFVSMSAMPSDQRTDEVLVRSCSRSIKNAGVDANVEARVVTDKSEPVASLSDAVQTPFTARSTVASMRQAIDEALRTSDAVLAISDQAITYGDSRLAVVSSAGKPDNVGIDYAIAVESPQPMLMLQVANDSMTPSSPFTVRIRTGDAPVVMQEVMLPPPGDRASVFITIPRPAEAIEVSLFNIQDELKWDDYATLVREHSLAKLVVDNSAPPIAARFAAAFERSAASPEAPTVTVHLRRALDDGLPGQLILAAPTRPVTGDLLAADHPIIRDVEIGSLRIDAVAAAPPGWKFVAAINGSPAIAVRESPRSVWIGFELDPLDARSVMLLANAVDWIAAAELSEWRGYSPDAIGKDWTPKSLDDDRLIASPGRYIDGRGREVAVNLSAVVGPRGRSRGDIGELLRRADRETFVPLSKPLAIGAAALACVATALSGRRPLP